MGSHSGSIPHPHTSTTSLNSPSHLSPLSPSARQPNPLFPSTMRLSLSIYLFTLTLTAAVIHSPLKYTKTKGLSSVSSLDRNLLAASSKNDKRSFFQSFRQDFQDLRAILREGGEVDPERREEYFNPQDVGLASPWKESRLGHLGLMKSVIEGKWGPKDIPK